MSLVISEEGLEPGESVVIRGRLHPWALSGGVAFGAVWLLAALLVVTRNDLAPGAAAQIMAAGILAALLCAVPPWLRWRRTEFIVTERRLLLVSGVFRRQVVGVPLLGAEMSSTAPPLGQVLGYGTLAVRARDGAEYEFPRVRDAEALQQRLRQPRGKDRPG